MSLSVRDEARTLGSNNLIRGGVQISRSDKEGTRVNPNEEEDGRATKNHLVISEGTKEQKRPSPSDKTKTKQNTRAGSIVPYARGRVLDRYVQYRYISLVCL